MVAAANSPGRAENGGIEGARRRPSVNAVVTDRLPRPIRRINGSARIMGFPPQRLSAALVAAIDDRGDAVHSPSVDGPSFWTPVWTRVYKSGRGHEPRIKGLHRRRAPIGQLSRSSAGRGRAVEQREQHESSEKAAEMGDPGDRHVGKKPEHLSSRRRK